MFFVIFLISLMHNDLIERYLDTVAVKDKLYLSVKGTDSRKSRGALHIDRDLKHNAAVLKGTYALILRPLPESGDFIIKAVGKPVKTI